MRKLTVSDVGSPYTFKALKRARIESVNDILHAAGVTWQDFLDLSAREVVDMLCEHCEDLERFGEKSKTTLEAFLKKNRRVVLQEHFEDAYTQSNADVREGEDDNYIPDLGDTLPAETLLINVSVIKGAGRHACIEDVISQIEHEILSADSELSEDLLRLAVLEAIEIDEWPTDRPIYISEHAARVYPEIVVALTKSALLVLK